MVWPFDNEGRRAEESDELSTSACTPLCIHQGIRHRLAGGKRAFGRHDVPLSVEDTADM